MAKRDMIKTVEKAKGNVPSSYDLSMDEFKQLLDMAYQGKADGAIIAAFKYGYCMGTRSHAAGNKKV